MSRHRARGQTLAEFALVLPILLLLFLAMFDLGRAVYAYNTVSNAARSALRVAIVDQDRAAVEAKAREQAMVLDQAEIGVVMELPVPDPPCDTATKIGCIVRVEVTYRWRPITPIINSLFERIDLSAASEMPIERVHSAP